LLNFTNVPGADDQAPAVWAVFDLFDYTVNLIDRTSIARAPVAPLRSIDAAQVAVLICPHKKKG
jgi:hypothetical protein